MKKLLFYLSICLGVLNISCQKGNKLDMESFPETPKTKQEEIEEIPRTIHQAATKQLIGSIGQNEVLCIVMKPEDFGINAKNFLAVLNEGDNGKIFFVMQQAMQDLGPILQQYYRQNPVSMRVIKVANPYDFRTLTAKTGTGAGTNKSNYRGEYIGNTYEAFAECIKRFDNVKTLDLSSIRLAIALIPEQADEWSCGPNSAARALILADKTHNQGSHNWNETNDFNVFLNNCPKSIDVTQGIDNIARSSSIAIGTFIGIFNRSLATSVMANISQVALSLPTVCTTKAGPSPHRLSSYINSHLPSTYKCSIVCSYDNFADCANAIIQDMSMQDPVIAFFLYGPTTWHYANIVATTGSSSVNFIVLDTNKWLKSLDYDNMEHLIRNDYSLLTYFGCSKDIRKYTIIRFYKK